MFDPNDYVPYFDIVTNNYTASAGGFLIAKPNSNRVAVYFTVQAGLTVYVGFSPQVSQSTAQFQFPGGQTYKLFWSQDGVICQQGFYMFTTSPGALVVVTELLWYPHRT